MTATQKQALIIWLAITAVSVLVLVFNLAPFREPLSAYYYPEFTCENFDCWMMHGRQEPKFSWSLFGTNLLLHQLFIFPLVYIFNTCKTIRRKIISFFTWLSIWALFLGLVTGVIALLVIIIFSDYSNIYELLGFDTFLYSFLVISFVYQYIYLRYTNKKLSSNENS